MKLWVLAVVFYFLFAIVFIAVALAQGGGNHEPVRGGTGTMSDPVKITRGYCNICGDRYGSASWGNSGMGDSGGPYGD